MQDDKVVAQLKCKVFRVMYHRDLFAICDCITEERISPEVTSYVDEQSGKLHFIALGDGLCTTPGQSVILSGQWEFSEKYGNFQLRIHDCYDHVGTSREDVVSYLSSKILKGIGRKTAESIYDRFGERTLDVIETTPQRLMEVSGIKKKKLAMILASYEKNRSLHSLTRLLSPFSISYKTIVRIHRRLGEGAAALVRKNPYCLCDMACFGFKKTDEIALMMGDFSRSPFRIHGAILYVLRQAELEEKHLYLLRGDLICRCCSEDVLNNGAAATITADEVSAVLHEMIEDETVHLLYVEAGDASERRMECVYLNDNFDYEMTVSERISDKLSVNLKFQDWDSVIRDTEDELATQLDEVQFMGARMALGSPISVITGGPGTGKTTGLRVIVAAYGAMYPNKRIQLAAPTGRAARRMSEQTGMEARTLHSLLHLKPDTFTNFSSTVDEDEVVRADFLVIDEASMIDAHLMAELMFRLRKGTQVLFLGDIDQLPSIGAGNVLRQLLSCEALPHVKLEKIFRQADGSVIPCNAANIKNGKFSLTENSHFKIFRCRNEEEGAETIKQLHERCRAKGMVESTQVLCPMRKRGATGTNQLNVALQEILNPKAFGKVEATVGPTLFRVGDKVIQTRNIEDVSNGDIGYIHHIYGLGKNDDDFRMDVYFDSCGKIVTYDYEEALDLELAYAITIHKSQGSEFSAVIVPMFKNMGYFLCRNLLYTAVTRAKDQVVLVTDLDCGGLGMAIRKEDSSQRNTMLARLIESEAMQ